MSNSWMRNPTFLSSRVAVHRIPPPQCCADTAARAAEPVRQTSSSPRSGCTTESSSYAATAAWHGESVLQPDMSERIISCHGGLH
ncbi:hypothetical protein T4A_4462 [Trichinella pseudospiralis]|uniref:Uncharacterized protein n=1 Tax=Trichinella pseudospiralis TaxID=6337 RepID=A0A0V1DUA3_TRIPS|nr:hypothetical protein T4A_4462 [Trichinella pseudospiralis]